MSPGYCVGSSPPPVAACPFQTLCELLEKGDGKRGVYMLRVTCDITRKSSTCTITITFCLLLQLCVLIQQSDFRPRANIIMLEEEINSLKTLSLSLYPSLISLSLPPSFFPPSSLPTPLIRPSSLLFSFFSPSFSRPTSLPPPFILPPLFLFPSAF